MASKQLFFGTDEKAEIRFAEDRRRSTSFVYALVLIVLIICILVLATAVIILSNYTHMPGDSLAIFNLQQQIDALKSQLESSQDCKERIKRQAPNNQLSIPNFKRNGTGVAQLFVGPPSNITMEGQWKLIGSVNQHQFMYFGPTILHWKESEVFDPSHYELACNGGIRVLQSGLYYIRAYISVTTQRNMEAISIICKGKPLVTMQMNTLARALKESDNSVYHVFNPATYAYLEAGSEIMVQTLTKMDPRTSIIMTSAASHVSLEKISN